MKNRIQIYALPVSQIIAQENNNSGAALLLYEHYPHMERELIWSKEIYSKIHNPTYSASKNRFTFENGYMVYFGIIREGVDRWRGHRFTCVAGYSVQKSHQYILSQALRLYNDAPYDVLWYMEQE